MIKKTAYILLVIFITGSQFSCKHEIPVAPGIDPVPVDTSVAGRLCFKYDILPIFIGRCAVTDCHDATSRAENMQLDSWANIMATGKIEGSANNSKMYQVLVDRNLEHRMPLNQSPLPQDQIDLIAKWINAGARNDSTNCTNSCDSTHFLSYDVNVKPIIQTHCLGCHTGSTPAGGGIALDTYAGVKQVGLFGRLLANVSYTGANPMPKGGPKLSDCKIAIIRKWIAAGAQP